MTPWAVMKALIWMCRCALVLLCACSSAEPPVRPVTQARVETGTRQAPNVGSSEEPHPSCDVYEGIRQGRYPTDVSAEAFWRGMEVCYAPNGDLCERGWVSLSAMPSMADNPTDEELAAQRGRFLRRCRALPIEVQRCFTSYIFGHESECPPGDALRMLNEIP